MDTTENEIIPFEGPMAAHHLPPRAVEPARLIPGRLKSLAGGQYAILYHDKRSGISFETLWPLGEGAVRKFLAIHSQDLTGWHLRNADGEVLPLANVTEEFFGGGIYA